MLESCYENLENTNFKRKAACPSWATVVWCILIKGAPPPGADTGFFWGARNPPPPPTAVCNIFFIFKPTDVNFPLPFKFHCRIQST